ncbi:hypothetical protein BDN70DRAFT_861524 [Pholiota conissans]|uniref:C2H2-type domain-containing protein n=1 Tax=Pholiota conissans TaxID=109636 RepID=A0A9P5YXS3_9AGAR|nr:hypothetical protein BDN70DRAFT_861524 [Pholiota conissans]
MPRAESQAKQHLGAQFYHSQFTGAQYLPDSNSSTSSPPLSPASSQQPSSPPTSAASGSAAKKKHVCGVCDRAFTTSGHLARHSRVHTGERNHKCPFPGCETRCSRQDNLQQHYRIHLSPGSRRSSTRSTGSRNAKKAAAAAAQAAMAAAAAQEVSPPSPPMSPPPALEQARLYTHHSQSPPDSPPPLAQATLPATATLPLTATRMDAGSDRSSSSPDTSYTTPNHNLMPISSQALAMSGGNTQNYSYRSGAATYQDQSQGSGFAYVNTNSSNSMNSLSNGNSYSSAHDGYPMQHHSVQSRGHSPVSMSSRHSISHISHPQQSSYSQQNYSSSAGPASPASSQSVSSHHSGPPTPTYPVFHDDGSHGYHQSTNNGLMQADHSVMNTNHLQAQQQQQQQQSHVMHNAYTSNGMHNPVRSPPPILAPIQDVRVIRTRDEARHMQSHHTSTYLHHPQPIPTESYSYHETLGLAHGAWKGHNGLRKNVGMV